MVKGIVIGGVRARDTIARTSLKYWRV